MTAVADPAGAVAVERVADAPLAGGLLGRHLECPSGGTILTDRSLLVAGWVLPASEPAVAVEVVFHGRVARRAPVDRPRPDLAAAFPGSPHAGRAGYSVRLCLAGTRVEAEARVDAVLTAGRRIPVASFAIRPIASAEPLVSIVVTTHGDAHYLGDALQSALAQTHGHVEILVVDDGSPDNAEAVARRYPGVRFLRQPRRGLPAARNTGLHATAGDYVLFLDADDRLRPGAIAAGLRALATRPDAEWAYGGFAFVAFDGRILSVRRPAPVAGDPVRAFLRTNRVGMHASVLYRRQALLMAGGFDEALPAAEDLDMYLRLARHGRPAVHGEVIAEYRLHAGNMTRDAGRQLAATLLVTRRHGRAPTMRAARRSGIRAWRELYGPAVAAELRADHPGTVDRIRRTVRAVRLHPGLLVSSSPSGARRGAGARRRPAPRPTAIILAFHRVARAGEDPWGLCVAPEVLARHLAVLARDWCPLPLSGLCDDLRRGRLRDRSVAVTFDDGYADNLAALPLLRRHRIPATVFVSSGWVGGTAFWWDELTAIVSVGHLPDQLDMTIAGRPYRWRATDARPTPRGPAPWRAWDEPTTAAQRLYLDLWHALRAAPEEARTSALRSLRQWAGADVGAPAGRPLSVPELRRLAADPLVEIGAHSETHPLLAELPAPQLVREIDGSRRALARVTGAPVAGFSYPYGSGAYDAAAVAEVRRAGYRYACGTSPLPVTAGSPLYELPRLAVADWEPDRLVAAMEAVAA